MKLGIMQPYFVPYMGYWQLLNAVDKYVIYDDVNYIKGGWINRNRILYKGEPKYINVPMRGASSFKLINEVGVNNDKNIIQKNISMIREAYEKAPFFDSTFEIIKEILNINQDNLASYVSESIRQICSFLEIKTELIMSSDIEKNNNLRGEEKVIHICEKLGATEYYNAIGGQELYSYEHFGKKNIKLKFMKMGDIRYSQFDNEFIPGLSILDVMMFNSKDVIKKFLENYTIIDK